MWVNRENMEEHEMNKIITNNVKETISIIPQKVINQYGAVLLATPILIYAINKIYELVDNVMKQDYSLVISYDNFELKLKKEIAVS